MKKSINKLNIFQDFCLCVCISMWTSYSLVMQIFLFYFTHSILRHKKSCPWELFSSRIYLTNLSVIMSCTCSDFFSHWHLQQLWKNRPFWLDSWGVCIIACCLCDIQEVCFFPCWLIPYFCLTKPAQILLFINSKNLWLSLHLPSQGFYLSSFHSLENVSLLTNIYSSGHSLCDTWLL